MLNAEIDAAKIYKGPNAPAPKAPRSDSAPPNTIGLPGAIEFEFEPLEVSGGQPEIAGLVGQSPGPCREACLDATGALTITSNAIT